MICARQLCRIRLEDVTNLSNTILLPVVVQVYEVHEKSEKFIGLYYKPLEMIFKQFIKTGFFPSELKKANIVPIHKKGDKQTLENCRPVSLLPSLKD